MEATLPAVMPPEDGIWTMKHIVKLIDEGLTDSIKVIPEDTVPVSWNGVEILLTRGIEIEIPRFHYDVYMNSRKATMEMFDNARKSLERRAFGPGQTSVESGWNGNAP